MHILSLFSMLLSPLLVPAASQPAMLIISLPCATKCRLSIRFSRSGPFVVFQEDLNGAGRKTYSHDPYCYSVLLGSLLVPGSSSALIFFHFLFPVQDALNGVVGGGNLLCITVILIRYS